MNDFIFIFIHSIMMVSFLMVPKISKNDVEFGINVPTGAKKDSDIIAIRKRYILLGLILGVVVIIIQLLVPTNELYFLILLYGSLMVYMVVYLLAYSQMRALKKDKQWTVAHNKTVIDTEFRKRQLVVAPKWYILYLLIFVLSVVTAVVMYDTLPEVLRTQVNSTGEGTTFMAKDRALMTLLVLQVIVMGIMVFVQIIIKKAKQTLSTTNTEKSIKANVSFRYAVSVILYVLGLAVGIVMYMSLLFTMGVIKDSQLFLLLTLAMTFIPIGLLLIYSFKYGQDGSRLIEEGSDVIDKDDDALWKLGVLYFNTKDPAIFVSKRVGIGWTINHARWQSWLIYGLLIAFVVITLNL